MTESAAPTAQEREAWHKVHGSYYGLKNGALACNACGLAWPCATYRLEDALAAAEAELRRKNAALRHANSLLHDLRALLEINNA